MKISVTKHLEVLYFFFNNPTEQVHLRQLARVVDVSFPWVRKVVAELEKEKLVDVEYKHHLVLIKANRNNPLFVARKRSQNLFLVVQSGLLPYLQELYRHPEAIIIFGSYSRGEDTEQSDIDIAIITKRSAKPSLGAYEKKLKRRISIKELSKENITLEFLNTLANGIVLSGYLELR